ncbi:LPS export ABC transporter periplasmic protein LptC, partial [bacterium]|nr:LPS export ABC transporter periplasmic protein LptC [bacterium]
MSARKKAYAIAFFILALILLWAFLSAGFLTTGFSRSQVKTGKNRQEVEVSSMILTETKEDKKFWEIYGETGTYNSDEKIAMFKNVIGNFYDKNNEVAMSFESSQGTYNEEKNQIILYNETFIVIKGGISLKADRLVWSGSDKDIIATGNI